MTYGHFLTSQIFEAHTNKLMLLYIYAMPESGIPGKRAFDSDGKRWLTMGGDKC